MNTRVWNLALLTKTLWKIHLKEDTLWCKWIHHIYLKGSSIWLTTTKSGLPPLMKKMLEIRDLMVQLKGSPDEARKTVEAWNSKGGFDTAAAYDLFMPVQQVQKWHKVIWNKAIPPKFSFISWIVVLQRLPTKDRLAFLGMDTTCLLCGHQPETTDHLFFLAGLPMRFGTR